MFRKVLFPTDFSSGAKTELGCLMAFPHIREIHLLHVVRSFPIPVAEELMTRTTRQYLRDAKEHLESLSPEIAVSMEVVVSTDIPGAILTSAEKTRADLIAVSGYATGYRAAILLGKVPATLLCRGVSPANVLVMPNELIASPGGPAFRKFCPYLFSTVLCPTDFSASSQEAIAAAAAMREVRTIILLHVLQVGKACSPLTPHEAEDRLRALRDAIDKPMLKIETAVATGDPAREIARVAGEHDVPIIWMGVEAKGCFDQFISGSTVQEVVQAANRPVLVVRRVPGSPGNTG